MGIHVWLGTFPSTEAAVLAYDAAARDIHGPRAKLNFPSPADAVQAAGRKRGRAVEVVDLIDKEEEQRYTATVVKREVEATIESESSESGGALPDFSWQGVSAYDEIPTAHPALEVVEANHSGSSKRLRTEPEHSTDEASPWASDTAESDTLFDDAFLFGGQFAYFNADAYESLDNLFSADAVQSNAGMADRTWEKKKNAKGYVV